MKIGNIEIKTTAAPFVEEDGVRWYDLDEVRKDLASMSGGKGVASVYPEDICKEDWVQEFPLPVALIRESAFLRMLGEELSYSMSRNLA